MNVKWAFVFVACIFVVVWEVLRSAGLHCRITLM